MLLLEVSVCNFADLEGKICTENLANPLRESQKILHFLTLLMYGRPPGRPPDSIIANNRFCPVFNDVGFWWLQELNPSISIYATRALSGRLLFHARLRRPVLCYL